MAPIENIWYKSSVVSVLLLPLAWLFCTVVMIRRLLYRANIFESHRLPVPVIVVGNITVGGTGKTPLVAAIVEHLKDAGFTPAIVSRGYGGNATSWPQAVDAQSDPTQVGDEAVLLAQRCGCPVCVGPDRPQAGRAVLDAEVCDVIVSDDGLQHYALRRDIEIVVIDGVRRFGNGRCLPSGPLREPQWRLKDVDYVICNGAAKPGEIKMSLHMQAARNIKTPEVEKPLSQFATGKVHAVAGIGNPNRFFNQLKEVGLSLIEHAFQDHHRFAETDIQFGDGLPVLMTEKDAVKCQGFAQACHWVVPVTAEIDKNVLIKLTQQLRKNNG